MSSEMPVNILDVIVHKLTIADICKAIFDSIENNSRIIISNHNLHSIYLYHYSKAKDMQAFYSMSDYTYIDGMPMVLVGKLLGMPLERSNRITMLDLMPYIASEASRYGWRIFYLGSKPGVVEKGASVLRSMFSCYIYTHHGYFNVDTDSKENKRVIKHINRRKPHVLMVGMGMPRQEEWIFNNYEKLNVNVILNIGAYIDYVAGAIPTPPRWMGRAGLEWLYRLISEPRRLWSRYLVEPWYLVPLIVRDLVRSRIYPRAVRIGHPGSLTQSQTGTVLGSATLRKALSFHQRPRHDKL